MKIKIIDSIMGSGKTTWAINHICSNRSHPFVYITPYLDEIQRLKDATKDTNKMYEPNYYQADTKLESFHKLLQDGKNICSTHALFQKANNITREALKVNEYVLILDEVMNVVEELKNFSKGDFKLLLDSGTITIEDDFVVWHDESDINDSRYADIRTMAHNKSLVCINDKILYWNFPVDIFGYFKEVYVLTYMFNAQIQKYYYDFHGLKYETYQVENGMLIEYNSERDNGIIKELGELIDIYEGKYNNIGDEYYTLHVSWFNADDGTLCKILAKNLNNWFNNMYRGCKSDEKLWTTFREYKTRLSGKGYSKRFLQVNSRATNAYRKCYLLAYCANRFLSPQIDSFFRKKGIIVNQEEYALSELLQWIWRSRIRDGKNIILYLPSSRMRNLLYNYLTK